MKNMPFKHTSKFTMLVCNISYERPYISATPDNVKSHTEDNDIDESHCDDQGEDEDPDVY